MVFASTFSPGKGMNRLTFMLKKEGQEEKSGFQPRWKMRICTDLQLQKSGKSGILFTKTKNY